MAKVDFPDPDSPAITSTSPLCSENVTSSTALTIDVLEPNRLFLIKSLDRPSTLKISLNKHNYFPNISIDAKQRVHPKGIYVDKFLLHFIILKTIQKELGYIKHVMDDRLSYFEQTDKKFENTFADELFQSLNQKQKSIDPKFFYDEKGSKLFEKICSLPEYYLTRAEISILKQLEQKFPSYLDGDFRLVELGSGSSTKTQVLIDVLVKLQKHVEYFPIDISKILKDSCLKLQYNYKTLHITGIIDNYERGLEFVKDYDDKKNLIVFLGSSYGNFYPEDGLVFLQKINSFMKKNDLFLIGLDLVKEKTILEKAYNDARGVTAQFNLNILTRINSELGGNFDTRKFAHHAIYNENKNRIEIYLRSLSNQTVIIPKSNLVLQIDENELIHTENSHKFTKSQIIEMFGISGFQINDIWYDQNKHFCLALLSKKD